MGKIMNPDFVYEFNNNRTCEYITPLSSVELDVYDNVIEDSDSGDEDEVSD